jgi:hypothetical protein
MATPPKVKSEPASAPARDRTSSIVAATLILLTVLGIVTVFWEPLAALASGAAPSDSFADPRSTAPDAGAGTTPVATDASASS